MITVVVGKEIEKIKGDFESYLNGLNMVGEISYSQYSKLYDEGVKQIQRAYELGKSELEEVKKANEWHYVKDGDLPTKELEEEQLLVRVRNYVEDYIFAYYMKDKYCSKNGKRFYSDTDCDYPIDIEDIIAWKEIVLPELKESK